MTTAYGYILLPSYPHPEYESAKARMEEFWREKLSHLRWGGLYADVATEKFRSVERRKAGGELNLRVDKGDHVIVVRLKDVLDNIDYMRVVNNWRRHGAMMHVLGFPELSEEEAVEAWRLAEQVSAWAAEKSKKRAARATATKRAMGKQLNQSVPPGFKLVGPSGRRRLVPCPIDRKAMAMIYEMRTGQQLSWRKIAVKLWLTGVLRRGGEEWTAYTVEPAFYQECKLREVEQQGDGQGPINPS